MNYVINYLINYVILAKTVTSFLILPSVLVFRAVKISSIDNLSRCRIFELTELKKSIVEQDILVMIGR